MKRILSSIGAFFSQGALDLRLVPASRSSASAQLVIKKAPPSRWRTIEFAVYYTVFIIVVPLMFKTAMEASNETSPNYWIYQRILSDGWINGRKVDNSDAQYRFFRNNFPLLLGLMMIHVVLKRFVLKRSNISVLKFDRWFGVIFLMGLHGFNSIRIAMHCGIMFCLLKYVPHKKSAILLTWIYGVSSLFFNDRYRLVKFGSISPILSVFDSFHGIIERWDVFYNFTLLRILSFNLDYIKKLYTEKEKPTTPDTPLEEIGGDSGSEQHNAKERNEPPKTVFLPERERLDAPLPLSDYSLANYISYVTYTPLFIAGPIITFNDYIYQTRHISPFITRKNVTIYALRFIFCILTMEFVLHYIYVVAVSKLKLWHNDTPFQISMIGLFNLNIIWLKLLIPWRMFRLWALLDNIDPPENMIRCMDDNFSLVSFWRLWHRSLSRWAIRYIYIPLGGASSRILTSLCVFSFVAIWHDIQLRLLIWGWLIVLFLLPEVLISQYFKKYSDKWWYRHLCGVGSVVNIWMMMVANLFGFCLGEDGTKDFLKKLFLSLDGAIFFVTSSACLFVGVQIMYELRAHEERRGINAKC